MVKDEDSSQHVIDYNEFFRDFLSAGISAAFAKTLGAPIERVKLILQVQEANQQLQESKQYRGTLQEVSLLISSGVHLSLRRYPERAREDTQRTRNLKHVEGKLHKSSALLSASGVEFRLQGYLQGSTGEGHQQERAFLEVFLWEHGRRRSGRGHLLNIRIPAGLRQNEVRRSRRRSCSLTVFSFQIIC